jgi:hypothetical protein
MTRLMLLFLPVTILVAACSSSAAPVASTGVSPSTGVASGDLPADGMTQTNEGGQVTVVATWAGPAAGATFDVKLDTHSVDLDALNLADAALRNDRGDRLAAIPWTAPAGGHHREGTLTFNGNAAAFLAGAKKFELVLLGVGDTPERVLRWTVGSQP